MKSKLFLAFILFSPILIIVFSTLSFNLGYRPADTKNNGTFFKTYFQVPSETLVNIKRQAISFDDGKWVLAHYYLNNNEYETTLRLMRQLNVALNRDIFRLKRVLISDDVDLDKNIHSKYPNLEIYFDLMNDFKSLLDQNSDQFFNSSKIFLIDPYGRAVMYFDDELDPKLILQDLKVLI